MSKSFVPVASCVAGNGNPLREICDIGGVFGAAASVNVAENSTAARGSAREASFKPTWLGQCWLQGLVWPGPILAVGTHQRRSLSPRHHPASPCRTHIFVVTGRGL
jgi:hypothetical protein